MILSILNDDSLEIVDKRNKSHHIQNCTKLALIVEFNCISTMGTKLATSIECLAVPPSQRSTTPVYAGLFRVAGFTLSLLPVGHGISVEGSTQYETTSWCLPRFPSYTPFHRQVTFSLVYIIPLLYNCHSILIFSSRQHVSTFRTFTILLIRVTLLLRCHSHIHLLSRHLSHTRFRSHYSHF